MSEGTPDPFCPEYQGRRARRYQLRDFGLSENEQFYHPRILEDLEYDTVIPELEEIQRAEPRRPPYQSRSQRPSPTGERASPAGICSIQAPVDEAVNLQSRFDFNEMGRDDPLERFREIRDRTRPDPVPDSAHAELDPVLRFKAIKEAMKGYEGEQRVPSPSGICPSPTGSRFTPSVSPGGDSLNRPGSQERRSRSLSREQSAPCPVTPGQSPLGDVSMPCMISPGMLDQVQAILDDAGRSRRGSSPPEEGPAICSSPVNMPMPDIQLPICEDSEFVGDEGAPSFASGVSGLNDVFNSSYEFSETPKTLPSSPSLVLVEQITPDQGGARQLDCAPRRQGPRPRFQAPGTTPPDDDIEPELRVFTPVRAEGVCDPAQPPKTARKLDFDAQARRLLIERFQDIKAGKASMSRGPWAGTPGAEGRSEGDAGYSTMRDNVITQPEAFNASFGQVEAVSKSRSPVKMPSPGSQQRRSRSLSREQSAPCPVSPGQTPLADVSMPCMVSPGMLDQIETILDRADARDVRRAVSLADQQMPSPTREQLAEMALRSPRRDFSLPSQEITDVSAPSFASGGSGLNEILGSDYELPEQASPVASSPSGVFLSPEAFYKLMIEKRGGVPEICIIPDTPSKQRTPSAMPAPSPAQEECLAAAPIKRRVRSRLQAPAADECAAGAAPGRRAVRSRIPRAGTICPPPEGQAVSSRIPPPGRLRPTQPKPSLGAQVAGAAPRGRAFRSGIQRPGTRLQVPTAGRLAGAAPGAFRSGIQRPSTRLQVPAAGGRVAGAAPGAFGSGIPRPGTRLQVPAAAGRLAGAAPGAFTSGIPRPGTGLKVPAVGGLGAGAASGALGSGIPRPGTICPPQPRYFLGGYLTPPQKIKRVAPSANIRRRLDFDAQARELIIQRFEDIKAGKAALSKGPWAGSPGAEARSEGYEASDEDSLRNTIQAFNERFGQVQMGQPTYEPTRGRSRSLSQLPEECIGDESPPFAGGDTPFSGIGVEPSMSAPAIPCGPEEGGQIIKETIIERSTNADGEVQQCTKHVITRRDNQGNITKETKESTSEPRQLGAVAQSALDQTPTTHRFINPPGRKINFPTPDKCLQDISAPSFASGVSGLNDIFNSDFEFPPKQSSKDESSVCGVYQGKTPRKSLSLPEDQLQDISCPSLGSSAEPSFIREMQVRTPKLNSTEREEAVADPVAGECVSKGIEEHIKELIQNVKTRLGQLAEKRSSPGAASPRRSRSLPKEQEEQEQEEQEEEAGECLEDISEPLGSCATPVTMPPPDFQDPQRRSLIREQSTPCPVSPGQTPLADVSMPCMVSPGMLDQIETILDRADARDVQRAMSLADQQMPSPTREQLAEMALRSPRRDFSLPSQEITDVSAPSFASGGSGLNEILGSDYELPEQASPVPSSPSGVYLSPQTFYKLMIEKRGGVPEICIIPDTATKQGTPTSMPAPVQAECLAAAPIKQRPRSRLQAPAAGGRVAGAGRRGRAFGSGIPRPGTICPPRPSYFLGGYLTPPQNVQRVRVAPSANLRRRFDFDELARRDAIERFQALKAGIGAPVNEERLEGDLVAGDGSNAPQISPSAYAAAVARFQDLQKGTEKEASKTATPTGPPCSTDHSFIFCDMDIDSSQPITSAISPLQRDFSLPEDELADVSMPCMLSPGMLDQIETILDRADARDVRRAVSLADQQMPSPTREQLAEMALRSPRRDFSLPSQEITDVSAPSFASGGSGLNEILGSDYELPEQASPVASSPSGVFLSPEAFYKLMIEKRGGVPEICIIPDTPSKQRTPTSMPAPVQEECFAAAPKRRRVRSRLQALAADECAAGAAPGGRAVRSRIPPPGTLRPPTGGQAVRSGIPRPGTVCPPLGGQAVRSGIPRPGTLCPPPGGQAFLSRIPPPGTLRPPTGGQAVRSGIPRPGTVCPPPGGQAVRSGIPRPGTLCPPPGGQAFRSRIPPPGTARPPPRRAFICGYLTPQQNVRRVRVPPTTTRKIDFDTLGREEAMEMLQRIKARAAEPVIEQIVVTPEPSFEMVDSGRGQPLSRELLEATRRSDQMSQAVAEMQVSPTCENLEDMSSPMLYESGEDSDWIPSPSLANKAPKSPGQLSLPSDQLTDISEPERIPTTPVYPAFADMPNYMAFEEQVECTEQPSFVSQFEVYSPTGPECPFS